MKHKLMRLLAATAVVYGGGSQVWAQGAAPALPTIANLARSAVPIDSVSGQGPGRGVYTLFASPTAVERLRVAGLTVADNGLVYVGKTDRSFRERLAEHRNGTSNVGRTVRSVLRYCAAGLRCPAVVIRDVQRFIGANFRVATVPLNDTAAITAAENNYIRTASPALNLDGVNNANSRRLRELHRLLVTPVRSAVLPNMMKGAGIVALIELPVSAMVGYLDVRNGRKTPEEAVRDGAGRVGSTAAAGAGVAGIVSAAAAAGITIPGVVAVPVVVGATVYYAYYVTERIWNALDEETKAELEKRFAAAVGEVEQRFEAQGGDPRHARGAGGPREQQREQQLEGVRERFGRLHGRLDLDGWRDAIAEIWRGALYDGDRPVPQPLILTDDTTPRVVR